jgi:predicted glycoside hydrolase/deacetylase ChbG (UPF0249 family)
MEPNPYLKRLGLAETDRLVILHADDIGMCQASITAFADMVEFGLISSGATMTPCSWFPQVAARFARPDVDLGVHLTLNAEWDAYRWGPLSTRDPASGLLDDEGYSPRTVEVVQARADPVAVQVELQAQVARALAAGIDVTHIDTHMGTVMHGKFIASYIQLALQHRLPVMLPRMDAAALEHLGMERQTIDLMARTIEQLQDQGVPLIDHIEMLPLDQPDNRVEQAKRRLAGLPAGITHFIIHPAVDTPELRAIAPDWPSRVADYQAFTRPELLDYVRASGIQVIGYRALREAWRGLN